MDTKGMTMLALLYALAGCQGGHKRVEDRNLGNNVTALSLRVGKTALNKDENTSIEVTATMKDNSQKEVGNRVQWVMRPADAVSIANGKLTAKRDVPVKIQAKLGTITSNTIDLAITWTVNGHTLPPEPDPKVNNASLLGVDVNRNGVRDDVERWIIIEEAKNPYFPKTWTALSLQYAWSRQKIIENPTLESRKFLEAYSACREYFIDKHTKHMNYKDYRRWRKEHNSILGTKRADKLFNTKERIMQRLKFNENCNGHIFSLPKPDINQCQTNIDFLGE